MQESVEPPPQALSIPHKEFRKITSPLSSPELDLIKYYFGKDFILEGGKGNYSHILSRFLSTALDPGLRKGATFENENLPPVPMLNRQSFLAELKKKAGFREGENNYGSDKKFAIFQMDLSGLKQADNLKDEEGNNAADYDINLFASALNEFKTELNIDGIKPEDIIIGRYGGDEFSIALVGEKAVDQHVIDLIQLKIKEVVEQKDGYFLVNGEKVSKKLKLKDGEADVITPPEGDKNVDKQKIFYSFLKRGLVLNATQIESELAYINETYSNVDKYLEKTFSKNQEYDNLNIEKKIKYITSRHSELIIPFQAVATSSTKQENLLRFVENYLMDPLMDEMVISRFDLPNHMRDDSFKKVHSFEIKMKEINDNLSYVYGDQVISSLWKGSLKEILDKYISEGKVKIGRFGGTIFIGEIGDGLSQEDRERLKNVSEVSLKYGKNDVTHTIGYAEIDASEIKKDSEDIKVKEKIDEVFNKPTGDWLSKVFKRLFDSPNGMQNFFDIYHDGDASFKYEEGDYFVTLLAKYFNGKRWEGRTLFAEQILGEMKETYPESVKQVLWHFENNFQKLSEKYK